ncbi:MAG: NUDIX hydrolase, partial [Porticoccaceae bacterium]|nr:NUDIX hydrolase [Porticoccaceae bacterium]
MTAKTLINTLSLPVVESAGGLVCNRRHHILLIFKRGKWDMAKGRVEDLKCPQTSALREVNEETGLAIDKLTVEGKLVSTW